MRETVSRRLSSCAVSKLNFFYRRHKRRESVRPRERKEFIVWPSNGEWNDARRHAFNAQSLGQAPKNSSHWWKLRAKVICCHVSKWQTKLTKVVVSSCGGRSQPFHLLHTLHVWVEIYSGMEITSEKSTEVRHHSMIILMNNSSCVFTKRLNLSLIYWTPVESKIYKLKIRDERRSEKKREKKLHVSFYSIHLLNLYPIPLPILLDK